MAPRYASSDGLRVRQFDLDEGNHVRIARSHAGQAPGAFERGPGILARRGWINASKVSRSSLGAYQGLKPGSWKGSINGSRAQPTLPPILVTGPVDDG